VWRPRLATSHAYGTVTAAEAARLRDGGAQMVDVRATVEWRGGHVPGALHIPFHAMARRGSAELDADRPIVLVCATGHRSTLAARTLVKRGFSQVFDLRGGMIAWRRAGLPVEA